MTKATHVLSTPPRRTASEFHDRDLRERETFDNFIHLSVAVVQSATDMIEEIGGLKMRRRQYDYETHPRDMLDLRKALSKAVRALEAYDAMAATGRKTSTSDEFRASGRAVSLDLVEVDRPHSLDGGAAERVLAMAEV